MKKIVMFLFFGMLCFQSQAQKNTQNTQLDISLEYPDFDTAFISNAVVSTPPVFPGGKENLISYLHTGLVSKTDRKNTIIEFTINPEGDVCKTALLEGGNAQLIKLIHKMPKWQPAFTRGKSVNTIVQVHIANKMSNNVSPYVVHDTAQ